MSVLIIWAIVAIIIFSVLCYVIGRTTPPNDNDFGGVVFVSVAVSLFWPILLAIATIFGPFYLPYKLGARHRKKAADQKDMWDTLKK